MAHSGTVRTRESGFVVPKGGPESMARGPKARGPKSSVNAGRRLPTRHIDEQALNLRGGGATYSVIARRLKLERAADAHEAFIRAVRGRVGDERQELVTAERARLDQLEKRVRTRHESEPETLARR